MKAHPIPPLLVLLLLAALCPAAAAFSPSPPSPSPSASASASADIDDRRIEALLLGPACRREALAAAATGAAATLIGLCPLPASAGYRDEAPFDLARRRYFPGALRNNVAVLRTVSALLWNIVSDTRRRRNLAYANPRSTVVGYLRAKDETTTVEDSLAGMLGREYGGVVVLPSGPRGQPFDLAADLANLAAALPAEARKSKYGGGNVIIIFGPHVGISKEGRLGYVETDRERVQKSEYVSNDDQGVAREDPEAVLSNVKRAYRTIRDQVVQGVQAAAVMDGAVGGGTGLREVTVVGGITINRSKVGKDIEKGDDCFYPLLIKSFGAGGTVVDRYEGAFGDMGIPDKERQ